MQKHTPVFITNGCCEATHDSLPEVFAKLGLQHGEFDGEWYPLTKEESQYISDDEIVAAGTCVRTGYACLYQGKKWLYQMNADGSGVTPVVATLPSLGFGMLSRDGQRIAALASANLRIGVPQPQYG